jgi:hypothetical protein
VFTNILENTLLPNSLQKFLKMKVIYSFENLVNTYNSIITQMTIFYSLEEHFLNDGKVLFLIIINHIRASILKDNELATEVKYRSAGILV